MTINKIKNYWHLLEAIRSGKTLQWTNDRGSTWNDYSPNAYCSFSAPPEEYRVKPEKKWRAWTSAKEVPVGAWIRDVNNPNGISLILGCDDQHIDYVETDVGFAQETFQDAFENTEYSVDGGKTWLPCGIETAE